MKNHKAYSTNIKTYLRQKYDKNHKVKTIKPSRKIKQRMLKSSRDHDWFIRRAYGELIYLYCKVKRPCFLWSTEWVRLNSLPGNCILSG